MESDSIGILVNSLDISQKTVSIVQSLLKTNNPKIFVFYNEFPDVDINLPCTVLHMKEAWSFKGVLVSTCLYTTKQMLNMYGARKKYFYVWDFEWTKQQYNYNDIADVYLSDDLQLLARSQDHKKVIDNCWKPSQVIEDFEYEQLTKLLR